MKAYITPYVYYGKSQSEPYEAYRASDWELP